MDKPIYIIVEEDFQTIARKRFGRELTEDEMRTAIHCFENGIQWDETAVIAITEAIENK